MENFNVVYNVEDINTGYKCHTTDLDVYITKGSNSLRPASPSYIAQNQFSKTSSDNENWLVSDLVIIGFENQVEGSHPNETS